MSFLGFPVLRYIDVNDSEEGTKPQDQPVQMKRQP